VTTRNNQTSPAAVRRSLGDRLRAEAKHRGRPTGDVRREFVFQRFLGRLFTDPDCQWVLKGGTGLLVRIREARYSKDIDLVVPGEDFDLDDAVDSLRADIRTDTGDHLTFAIDSVTRPSGGQSGAMLRVTCYTGATPFERFTIDVSTRRSVVAQLDRVRPQQVIEIAGAEPLPEFVLYPLPDQIADKVCAMYGRYGATNMPSTRYRDLVDLVLIATTNELTPCSPSEHCRGRPRAAAAHSQPKSKIRALSGRSATPASLGRATCRMNFKRSTEPLGNEFCLA
jgi:predicted nucleotidyltransferase component of viral defense system